ncbi:hypothetical protein E2C01_046876 [Portunus trituberculatus]|uniref:Uncharacterized protein n=1 Tax=Portunus trituberculatus TaxID=210409 RepID=A0A5B7G236_PORTR|nr:hypothetical protein [Portunus trituberculatus]
MHGTFLLQHHQQKHIRCPDTSHLALEYTCGVHSLLLLPRASRQGLESAMMPGTRCRYAEDILRHL